MFESAFVPFFFRLLSWLPLPAGRRCLGGPTSDGTLCVRSGQLPANRKGERAPIPAGRRLVNVPNEVRCTTCFRPFVTRYCRPTGRLPAPLHHHLSLDYRKGTPRPSMTMDGFIILVPYLLSVHASLMTWNIPLARAHTYTHTHTPRRPHKQK